MWSATTWLIVINVAVHVIDNLLLRMGIGYVLGGVFPMGPLKALGYFSVTESILGLQVWRVITFQFLHGDLTHLLFNMFALHMFGNLVERYLGWQRYLAFYLLCGIGGPLAYVGLWGVNLLQGPPWIPLVGASAGIFGILAAAAVIAPRMRVMLLFPPVPVEMRTLVYIFLGIAAYTVLFHGPNAGGEAAHLGGAIVGFLLIRNPGALSYFQWGGRRKIAGPRPFFRE
jgi:membrane associated rhomboid family serine protease